MATTNILTEIAEIETRLRSTEPRVTLKAMLHHAHVNGAQWHRWRAGTQTPLISTWERVKVAADELAPQREVAA